MKKIYISLLLCNLIFITTHTADLELKKKEKPRTKEQQRRIDIDWAGYIADMAIWRKYKNALENNEWNIGWPAPNKPSKPKEERWLV